MTMSIAVFSVFGLLTAIFATALYYRKENFAKPIICGVVLYFFCYIVFSMVLFVMDQFTLKRAVMGTMDMLIVITCPYYWLMWRKHGKLIRILHWDGQIKTILVPLLVSIIALPLILTKNELFGMGQDQGVYQVVAINLMHGLTDRQQDFAEYHLLSNTDQTAFAEAIRSKLVGYDIASSSYPETIYDRTVSPVSGIYHGIPTYSAMLALFGTLFGVSNMLHLETVFWICMIFLISFICHQMKWKRSTEVLACGICAISPVIMWVAKSSLTEMFLTVILLVFVMILTDAKRQHWLSLFPIAVFGCYHVSIYTMVPLFVVLYGALYLFQRKGQYAIMTMSTIVIYFISYFAMRHVQPFYTMNNYRFLFVGGITVYNITTVVIIACIVAFIVSGIYCLLLYRHAVGWDAQYFLQQTREKKWLRIIFAALLIVPVVYILLKGISQADSIGELRYLTLVGYAINTGFVLLPIACVMLLFQLKTLFDCSEKLILFVMFLYCILVYSAFLRFEVEYYYYYARYLAPFIPIAVLFAAMVLDKYHVSAKVSMLSACMFVLHPFTTFLASAKDDTRMEWSILEDLAEQITEDGCLIVEKDLMPQLFLPLRSMTGAAVYPESENAVTQIDALSVEYDKVYYLTTDTSILQYNDAYNCIYRNTAHHSEDDLMQHGTLFPLPTAFLEYEEPICLYQYTANQRIYEAVDNATTSFIGFGALEHDFCWSVSEEASVFCTLHPENYVLQIEMGCEVPLETLGLETMPVSVYINGVRAGELEITEKNNGGTLSLPISELLLNTSKNQIMLQCTLWSASAVTPNDTRRLGIPLKTLRFVEK